MAKACKSVDANVARKQATQILQQAERKIGAGSSCQLKLQNAKSALAAVDGLKEAGLERRNAYIRATFHAGQALACATVEGISVAPAKKRAKKAAKAKPEPPAMPPPPVVKPKRVRKVKAS